LGLEASATDDAYNGLVLWVTGGTGKGQWATITDYTGASRAAAVAAMVTTLDTTSTYRVTEKLTGTPTIVDTATTSELTLGSKLVGTEPAEILGDVIPPGLWLSFTVTGQQAAKSYTVRITCATNGTTARTKAFDFCFEVAS